MIDEKFTFTQMQLVLPIALRCNVHKKLAAAGWWLSNSMQKSIYIYKLSIWNTGSAIKLNDSAMSSWLDVQLPISNSIFHTSILYTITTM